MTHKEEEVTSFEEKIIQHTRLIELLTKNMEEIKPEPVVHRDFYGTLHVNLLALSREARKLAEKLALRYGFQPRPVTPWGPETFEKVMAAKDTKELLGHALDALHSIGGSYFARRALFGSHNEKPRNLTEPLKKSMMEKAITDEQIESYTLEVWEAVVLRLHELGVNP